VAGEERIHVWSARFDLNRGVRTGELRRITDGPGRNENISVSADGRILAFSSRRSRPMNVWLRDMASGEESRAAAAPVLQRFAQISPSGAKLAYSSYENGRRSIHILPRGGTPEPACDGCFRATGWSRDESSLLFFSGDPYEIGLFNLNTRRVTPLLKHPQHQLLYARYSPDGKWISFTVRTALHKAWIAAAPASPPWPVAESKWVRIAEAGDEDRANWSPDGRSLYFTSGRDGHLCIWGQRLHPVLRRPAGEAFPVQHFHGALTLQHLGWAAENGSIFVVLREDFGNIWTMSPSTPP
jgi:Tol biopolymer transport system component